MLTSLILSMSLVAVEAPAVEAVAIAQPDAERIRIRLSPEQDERIRIRLSPEQDKRIRIRL